MYPRNRSGLTVGSRLPNGSDLLSSNTPLYVYLDECFFGLSKSPDITTCRIYTILNNDVNRFIIESDIRLSRLEEMLFFSALWDDTGHLFSHLTTPLLHTLEFLAPQDDLEFPKTPPLLLQSGSRLLKLKLNAFTFTSDEVELLELPYRRCRF